MEQLLLLIKDLAPTVATLLNGPLGDTIIELLSHMLSSPPTAVGVAKAIQPSPDAPISSEAVLKLKTLEASLAARQSDNATEKDSIDLVSAAYAKELARGPFWSALRPAAGWLMLASSAAFIVIVLKGAWLNNYTPLDHTVAYLGAISPLAAITGVYFWGRTSEKNTMLEAPKVPPAKIKPHG